MKSDNTVHLEPRAIATVYAWIAGLLVLMSLVGQIAVHVFDLEATRLVRAFDVSRERNVPTFFAVLLLLSASLSLLVIAVHEFHRRRREAAPWAFLSLGFLFMAYDEGFQVHELFIEPTRALLGGGDLGLLHYAWVLPFGAVVAVLGVAFLGFLRGLPRTTGRRFVLAAAVYLGGSIGVEIIGGGYDARHGYDNLGYNLISTLEEGLEMAGLVIFIGAILSHASSHLGSLQLRVVSRAGGAAPPRPARVRVPAKSAPAGRVRFRGTVVR